MYRSATDKTGQGITEDGSARQTSKHAHIFESEISELKTDLFTWLNYRIIIIIIIIIIMIIIIFIDETSQTWFSKRSSEIKIKTN